MEQPVQVRILVVGCWYTREEVGGVYGASLSFLMQYVVVSYCNCCCFTQQKEQRRRIALQQLRRRNSSNSRRRGRGVLQQCLAENVENESYVIHFNTNGSLKSLSPPSRRALNPSTSYQRRRRNSGGEMSSTRKFHFSKRAAPQTK